MIAVISSNYDDKYLWNIPLVTWGWNRLGVDVICFLPQLFRDGKIQNNAGDKLDLIESVINEKELNIKYHTFDCPEHKEATYTQCSRLYGGCLDLPEDEILVTSDVDMFVFEKPPYKGGFTIFGADLVPEKQYPMCYVSATVYDWRAAFQLDGKTYQSCLDELLSNIESTSMRSDYWAKDQEEIFNKISKYPEVNLIKRTDGSPFATKRLDRDDSYILDRLNTPVYDYHLNRPGYENDNFEIILKVLSFYFPHEDFGWLISYNEKYKQLL